MAVSFYDIYTPHLSGENAPQFLKRKDPGLHDFAKDATELADTICPVDEVTGLRQDVITKLMSPTLSVMERDKLMRSLQEIPVSKRSNLSDKELIDLLPSRYNSTLTDVDKVRDYVNDLIEFDTKLSEDLQADAGEDTGNDVPSSDVV